MSSQSEGWEGDEVVVVGPQCMNMHGSQVSFNPSSILTLTQKAAERLLKQHFLITPPQQRQQQSPQPVSEPCSSVSQHCGLCLCLPEAVTSSLLASDPEGNPLGAARDEVRQAQELVTRRLTASYLVGFCLVECRLRGNVCIFCSHWRFR